MSDSETSSLNLGGPSNLCSELQSSDPDIINSCTSVVENFKDNIKGALYVLSTNMKNEWDTALAANPALSKEEANNKKNRLIHQLIELFQNFEDNSTTKSTSVINHLHEINRIRQEYNAKFLHYNQVLSELARNDDDDNRALLAELEKEKDNLRRKHNEEIIEYNKKILELQVLLDHFKRGTMILEAQSDPGTSSESPKVILFYELLDEYRSMCIIPGETVEQKIARDNQFNSWRNYLQLPRNLLLPHSSPRPDVAPNVGFDESNVASPPDSDGTRSISNIEDSPLRRRHHENETLIRNVRKTYWKLREYVAFLIRGNIITEDYQQLQQLNDDVQRLSHIWRSTRPTTRDRSPVRDEPSERRDRDQEPRNVSRTTIKSIAELYKEMNDAKEALKDFLSMIEDDWTKIEELRELLRNLYTEMNEHRGNEDELLDREEIIHQELVELNQKINRLKPEIRSLRLSIIDKEIALRREIGELRQKLHKRKLSLENKVNRLQTERRRGL